jgi:cell division protein FtsI/penicillin-binding protein 2
MRSGSILMLAVLCSGVLPAGAAGVPGATQRALDSALTGTGAVAVVLDGGDGRLIAVERADEAGRRASAPGSTLKPFFLAAALRQGRVRAETTVVCRGDLRIAGRDLACTHPREENVLNAERALAYSCNTWFANLATRFAPQQAAEVLRAYGFGSRTGIVADESAGVVRTPANEPELQLLVLGLENVEVTPAQLAHAYFQLGREFDQVPVVRRGLEDSIVYGMAHNAATPGMTIAGKTGTAGNAGEAWTHGWFAGIASRGAKRVVVVIYVPRGNGADAAGLAHRFFEAWDRTAAG